jgi:hypothetical protein
VHVLRHAHRLLVPSGTLVDVHPITEEQVEAGGRPIGTIPDPDSLSGDLPNAGARVRDAMWEGLLELEAEAEFDVLEHFDEADELLDAKREHLAADAALARRIGASPPPLVTRQDVVLRRFRAR